MKFEDLRRRAAPLLSDRRARRLVPATAALLAALIAIPFLLAKPSQHSGLAAAGPVSTPTVPLTNVGTATTEAAAESGPAQPTESKVTQSPFVPPAPPKIKSARAKTHPRASGTSGTSSSPAPTTTTHTSTTSPSGTATSEPAATHTTTTTTATAPKPTSPPAVTYSAEHVTLQFGSAGSLKAYRDVARYQTLPFTTDPAAAYLGVEEDGTAVLLIASDVVPSGKGICYGGGRRGTYLTLQPGQSERLIRHDQDGTSTTYQLEFSGIRKTTSKRPIPEQVNPAGKVLIKYAAPDLAPLRTMRFAKTTGLLTITLPATTHSAAAVAGHGR